MQIQSSTFFPSTFLMENKNLIFGSQPQLLVMLWYIISGQNKFVSQQNHSIRPRKVFIDEDDLVKFIFDERSQEIFISEFLCSSVLR